MIAHFITTSGLYGAERWILGLLNHLDKSETLLIVPSTSDLSVVDEAKKLGINTKILEVKGNYSVFDFINKLSKVIKSERIKILHTHGYKADIIGYFAAKKSGIKIYSTPHGWSVDAGFKLKIYEALDRLFLRKFDLVVPHTEVLKRTLIKIKRIKTINNFIDLDSIPKSKKGDPKLITYIGQLIERKRVQDLILSLKYIDDVKLQIIGDGPKKKDLMSLVEKYNLQDRVQFLGFRDDRLKLLNESGILVLPSLAEYIPRVIMEAMATGKIVIGTDISGMRELIKNKETGLLVPVKSPKIIADAIKYILKNKEIAKTISENAKVLIEKEYSAERAAKEFEKLYKNE